MIVPLSGPMYRNGVDLTVEPVSKDTPDLSTFLFARRALK
jgi:hypothetical protein